jgi:glutaminyl-peptide cyclotransferase
VRPLVAVLIVQVVLGLGFVVLVMTGALPFTDEDDAVEPAASPALRKDRFDSARAFDLLERQVKMGPRPAGSPTSRKLAAELRRLLPHGRYQAVPNGLRNVMGRTRGRDPSRYIVVGAHYDTKDIPGFVGANDGAGGTAAVVELARTIKPRELRPTVVWILFDGEESPRGTPAADFEKGGLRGSKVAARRFGRARAMVLLDFVADKELRIPRESSSDIELWAELRRAARRVGAARHFPDDTQDRISDDHTPFLGAGVPSIDLIDFDFPCWHRLCDDLSAVSERSLDASGETVYELLTRM